MQTYINAKVLMQAATSFRRGWMLAALLALAAPAVALAQPQAVAGTRITLQPPEGFVAADRFPGFANQESGSSIMVTEVPAPFSQVTAGFTREQMAPRGMTLRSSEPLAVDGRQGMLLSITQSARGVAFDKWILAFGDDSMAVLVTGTYPQERAGELGEPIKQAVLSARLNTAGPADRFEGLGFRISEGSRLRIATRMGNLLLLNETGTLPNSVPGSPVLVVGSSFSEVDLADLEAFSRRRATQIATLSGVSNFSGGPLTIDGAAAYELFADAVNSDDGKPLKVYQAVIAEGNHYIIVQGFVGTDGAAEFIPEFQSIARTLRRTR